MKTKQTPEDRHTRRPLQRLVGPPCACGNPKASWRGERCGLREYLCEECASDLYVQSARVRGEPTMYWVENRKRTNKSLSLRRSDQMATKRWAMRILKELQRPNDGPFCAHLKVVYRRRERRAMVPGIDGHHFETTVCSDHWECADCGHPFSPVIRVQADPPPATANCGCSTPLETEVPSPETRNAPPLGSQPLEPDIYTSQVEMKIPKPS